MAIIASVLGVFPVYYQDRYLARYDVAPTIYNPYEGIISETILSNFAKPPAAISTVCALNR